MARAVVITRQEFENFVLPQGFQKIEIEGTIELVYAKIVTNGTNKYSMRIYSSITPDGTSRSVGADAIRVCLFYRNKANEPKMVGGDRRVHRVGGWRDNLAQRLLKWPEQIGPVCPKCGSPTVLREPKKGAKWPPFFGCIEYPNCNGSIKA